MYPFLYLLPQKKKNKSARRKLAYSSEIYVTFWPQDDQAVKKKGSGTKDKVITID